MVSPHLHPLLQPRRAHGAAEAGEVVAGAANGVDLLVLGEGPAATGAGRHNQLSVIGLAVDGAVEHVAGGVEGLGAGRALHAGLVEVEAASLDQRLVEDCLSARVTFHDVLSGSRFNGN